MAIAGFALSLVWVASAPFPLLDVWGQAPEAVTAALAIITFLSFFLAPVLCRLGFRQADRNRQPHRRLAIAGGWIWLVGYLVFAIALAVALYHALSF